MNQRQRESARGATVLVATIAAGSWTALATGGIAAGILVPVVQLLVIVAAATVLHAPGEYARAVRAGWARRRANQARPAPSPADRPVIDTTTDLGPSGTLTVDDIRQHWGEHDPARDDLEDEADGLRYEG